MCCYRDDRSGTAASNARTAPPPSSSGTSSTANPPRSRLPHSCSSTSSSTTTEGPALDYLAPNEYLVGLEAGRPPVPDVVNQYTGAASAKGLPDRKERWMATYRGKYWPLFRHLMAVQGKQWPVTFKEIEAILGFPLPASARKYLMWWANEDETHSQARAWRAAGWGAYDVDLRGETLVFERSAPSASIAVGRGGTKGRPAFGGGKHPSERDGNKTMPAANAGNTLTLGGQTFRYAVRISPEPGPDGKPVEHMPQRRYRYAASTPLNRHGGGPFCRLSLPGLPVAPGVYAVTVAGQLVYVGIATRSLRQRWGPSGYAQIQPRNCFIGGQSTNCKVNHRILLAARRGWRIDLWFHETANPRPLEERLIVDLGPPWNSQG